MVSSPPSPLISSPLPHPSLDNKQANKKKINIITVDLKFLLEYEKYVLNDCITKKIG